MLKHEKHALLFFDFHLRFQLAVQKENCMNMNVNVLVYNFYSKNIISCIYGFCLSLSFNENTNDLKYIVVNIFICFTCQNNKFHI